MGHISRDCPSSGGGGRGFGGGFGGQGGFGGPRKCYNCGQDGHISRECPSERAGPTVCFFYLYLLPLACDSLLLPMPRSFAIRESIY